MKTTACAVVPQAAAGREAALSRAEELTLEVNAARREAVALRAQAGKLQQELLQAKLQLGSMQQQQLLQQQGGGGGSSRPMSAAGRAGSRAGGGGGGVGRVGMGMGSSLGRGGSGWGVGMVGEGVAGGVRSVPGSPVRGAPWSGIATDAGKQEVDQGLECVHCISSYWRSLCVYAFCCG